MKRNIVLILSFLFVLNFIFASGWHKADEVLSGNFSGIYNFDNTPTVNYKSVQLRIDSSCSVGQSIRQINSDGTVLCQNDEKGTIPAGAVMAFNLGSCPSGWSEFTNARGRVIVGLNPSDGNFNSLREIGGEKVHTLTVNEMPSHRHSFYHGGFGSDVRSIPTNAGDGADGSVVRVKYTDYFGGNVAHNNLQPYIALIYCVKS